MHVCGQTLVLVDNDATVSAVNQKIVRSTLKYMFYHKPENRTFCLDTYGHDIEGEEVYTDDVNDLACAADMLTFEAKDSSLTDTLAEVITRWKDSDFACRDIIVFTDGLEGAALSHEKEELYYLTQNSGYPVYIVMLDQEDNASAEKVLSAIATTSKGKLYSTEFEGSDAQVDRQLSEKIFADMDEYATVFWAQYEEDAAEEEGEDEPGEIAETAIADEEAPEDTENAADALMSERVVYEYDRTPGFFESRSAVIMSIVLIAAGLIALVLGGFIIMKRKRKGLDQPQQTFEDDEEFFDDYELSGIATSELSDTTLLADDRSADSPTRLLSSGQIVTLKDTLDENRDYRIMLSGSMSIGRRDCDVVITGDDAVSKRHCELYEDDGEVRIRDLSSANGTKVNNEKISDTRLSDGDRLTIGARTYIVGLA